MGRAIFGRIVFLVNNMINGVMPEKCFFPEQGYWMENFLYACPNCWFLKADRLSSMSLRGIPCRGCKLSVTKWPLLMQLPPGLQPWSSSLLVSIVCFISLEQFLFKNSMEGAGKSCFNRKVGLHYLRLCQGPHSFTNSFTTHSSL